MKILLKIVDFYIQSSIHVAIAVFCLLQITIVSNQQQLNNHYSFCVFFGTVLGYNFLKYSEYLLKRNLWNKKYFSIVGVSALAGIGFLFSFHFLQYSAQQLILLSGLFVLIYPFLRNVGWLKLFLVSFTVTFITVYIPFQATKYLFMEFYFNLIQRFFIIISLLIPFEIMDSKTDDKSLNTLPQLFGIESTKLLGILLVIPFIILEFLKSHPSYLVLLIGIITVTFINFTETHRNKYYTSFWVESVPILWWILLYFF
jgi:hypothetical protein